MISDCIVIATYAKFKARQPDHSEQKSSVLGELTSKFDSFDNKYQNFGQ